MRNTTSDENYSLILLFITKFKFNFQNTLLKIDAVLLHFS